MSCRFTDPAGPRTQSCSLRKSQLTMCHPHRQSIEDLILLRKLRKAKQGIDLEKLNRGEEKRRKKKVVTDGNGEGDEFEGAADKYGLQRQKGGEDHDE